MPAPEGFVNLSAYGQNCWAQVVTLNLIPRLIKFELPPNPSDRFEEGYTALLDNFNRYYGLAGENAFTWEDLRRLFNNNPTNPLAHPRVQQIIFGPVLRQYYLNYVAQKVNTDMAWQEPLGRKGPGNYHHLIHLANSLGFMVSVISSIFYPIKGKDDNKYLQSIFGGGFGAGGNHGELGVYRPAREGHYYARYADIPADTFESIADYHAKFNADRRGVFGELETAEQPEPLRPRINNFLKVAGQHIRRRTTEEVLPADQTIMQDFRISLAPPPAERREGAGAGASAYYDTAGGSDDGGVGDEFGDTLTAAAAAAALDEDARFDAVRSTIDGEEAQPLDEAAPAPTGIVAKIAATLAKLFKRAGAGAGGGGGNVRREPPPAEGAGSAGVDTATMRAGTLDTLRAGAAAVEDSMPTATINPVLTSDMQTTLNTAALLGVASDSEEGGSAPASAPAAGTVRRPALSASSTAPAAAFSASSTAPAAPPPAATPPGFFSSPSAPPHQAAAPVTTGAGGTQPPTQHAPAPAGDGATAAGAGGTAPPAGGAPPPAAGAPPASPLAGHHQFFYFVGNRRPAAAAGDAGQRQEYEVNHELKTQTPQTRDIHTSNARYAHATFHTNNGQPFVEISQALEPDNVLRSLPKTLAALVHNMGNINQAHPIYLDALELRTLQFAYQLLRESFGIPENSIVRRLNGQLQPDPPAEIDAADTALFDRLRTEAGNMHTSLNAGKQQHLLQIAAGGAAAPPAPAGTPAGAPAPAPAPAPPPAAGAAGAAGAAAGAAGGAAAPPAAGGAAAPPAAGGATAAAAAAAALTPGAPTPAAEAEAVATAGGAGTATQAAAPPATVVTVTAAPAAAGAPPPAPALSTASSANQAAAARATERRTKALEAAERRKAAAPDGGAPPSHSPGAHH